MRLGFVSARGASVGADGVWMDAGVGRLLDCLRPNVESLQVAMSQAPERQSLHDHRVELAPGAFHALPWLPSVVGGLGKAGPARAAIAKVEAVSDVVVVQLPFAAFPALVPPKRPRVYHLCADIEEIVRTSPFYRGWKLVPARGLALSIDRLQRVLISRPSARMVANGRALLDRFGGPAKGRAIVSATVLDREIGSVTRQRPPDGKFRVLFVGHLRHEKGVGTLLEACERLAGTLPLELSIVGATNAEDRGVTADLRAKVEALGRRISVRFEGQKGFGPELFQCFADADLLALPSLSEGTPRVLVEARAFGCPVVASDVGGVPTSVSHEVDGLLVPPADAAALASAIARVANDEALRLRLQKAGVVRAHACSMEAMARAVLEEAERASKAG